MKWKKPGANDSDKGRSDPAATQPYRRRDGEKTTYVEPARTASRQSSSRASESQGRSGSGGRLSGPARDERPKKVVYYGADGDASDRTQLYDPTAAAAGRAEQKHEVSRDPVVGWLVIIDGPGKGRSVEIG